MAKTILWRKCTTQKCFLSFTSTIGLGMKNKKPIWEKKWAVGVAGQSHTYTYKHKYLRLLQIKQFKSNQLSKLKLL